MQGGPAAGHSPAAARRCSRGRGEHPKTGYFTPGCEVPTARDRRRHEGSKSSGHRRLFGGLVRERVWVFWRRVWHACHHRTQVQTWLRLAGHEPVLAVYGPSGDGTRDAAGPTYSLDAARRGVNADTSSGQEGRTDPTPPACPILPSPTSARFQVSEVRKHLKNRHVCGQAPASRPLSSQATRDSPQVASSFGFMPAVSICLLIRTTRLVGICCRIPAPASTRAPDAGRRLPPPHQPIPFGRVLHPAGGPDQNRPARDVLTTPTVGHLWTLWHALHDPPMVLTAAATALSSFFSTAAARAAMLSL